MLSSFTIRNYRSILDIRLDFSYGEGKAPNGHANQETLAFIGHGKHERCVPCMAFFGANASGKTNLIKAIGTLSSLVQHGGKLSDVFEPNLLNPKFTETTFSAEFYIKNDLFEYSITYSSSAIGDEALTKNGKPIFALKQLEPDFSATILTDVYTREKLKEILRVECSDGEGRQAKPFLHRIGVAYPGLNADLKNAFTYFGAGLVAVAAEGTIMLPFAVQILASAMGGDKVAALTEITEIIRRLDIDIVSVEIVQREISPDKALAIGDVISVDPQNGTRHSYQIITTHQNANGEPTSLDFMKHESAGTRRVAGLIGLILYALKSGSVLLVDELDCSLHALLMREIVLLFKKRHHNPNGAQLIFTTHNTEILDDSILRISEISLVRKTLANGTLVRRLVDIKKDGEDIRNVTNFRKQYLAGFYSGVPHPAL